MWPERQDIQAYTYKQATQTHTAAHTCKLCPWHWSLWPLPTASVVACKAGFLGAPQWEVGLGKLL